MTPERERPGQFTLEEVTRLACEVTLQHGSHVPTVIAQGDREPVIGQLPQLPDTHEGRVRLMFAAGHALGRRPEVAALRQVFFICEGWMSRLGRDGSLTLPPSQDPDRVEVLAVSGLDVADRHASLVLFEMVRDGAGQLVDLRQLDMGDGGEGQMESPLLDAFVDGFRAGTRGRSN